MKINRLVEFTMTLKIAFFSEIKAMLNKKLFDILKGINWIFDYRITAYSLY